MVLDGCVRLTFILRQAVLPIVNRAIHLSQRFDDARHIKNEVSHWLLCYFRHQANVNEQPSGTLFCSDSIWGVFLIKARVAKSITITILWVNVRP